MQELGGSREASVWRNSGGQHVRTRLKALDSLIETPRDTTEGSRAGNDKFWGGLVRYNPFLGGLLCLDHFSAPHYMPLKEQRDFFLVQLPLSSLCTFSIPWSSIFLSVLVGKGDFKRSVYFLGVGNTFMCSQYRYGRPSILPRDCPPFLLQDKRLDACEAFRELFCLCLYIGNG